MDKKAVVSEYYDFSIPGVDVTLATLESILINRFENNNFFTNIILKHDKKSYRASYPVVKSIAFAIKVGASIYVLKSILDKAAIYVRGKEYLE